MVINPPYYSSSKAKLYSRDITGSVCMRFYFYLYGKNTGHLKILTKRNKVKSIVEHVVFSHYGNYGHKWNFAQVYLDFPPTDVYQVFQANMQYCLSIPQLWKSCMQVNSRNNALYCVYCFKNLLTERVVCTGTYCLTDKRQIQCFPGQT